MKVDVGMTKNSVQKIKKQGKKLLVDLLSSLHQAKELVLTK